MTRRYDSGTASLTLSPPSPRRPFSAFSASRRSRFFRLESTAMNDARTYVETLGRDARRAAQQLAALRPGVKVAALNAIAAAIRANRAALLDANAKDIAAAEEAKLDRPLIERLRLNDKRVDAMALSV